MIKKKIVIILIFAILIILGFLFVIMPMFFQRYWWIDYSDFKKVEFSFSKATLRIPKDWHIDEDVDNTITFIDENGEAIIKGYYYSNEFLEEETNNKKYLVKHMSPSQMMKKYFGEDAEIIKEGESKYLAQSIFWQEYYIKNSSLNRVYIINLSLNDCDQTVELITTNETEKEIIDKILKSLRC